jgi:hypothetical protein
MADITVTIPNSTFTIDTISNGIEVTTPTSVEVNVDSNSNTIDITNTPQQITVLTSGTLNINSSGVITSVNGQTGPAVVLDTDDILEGTNKYFSQALARASLSAGTGISYDNVTGIITNTSINTDTTYTIISASTSGGANLTLTGSDASTDSVAYKGSGATTVTSTDANTITISSTDTNTTYTQNASSVSGGANLNLVGSDATTDSIKLASGTNVTVTRTDADTVTISSTDTNTTYTQNISSTSGGANLNLVGSDATTDTVKFADGTGVAVAFTDVNTATISIGQPVATTDAVTFGSVSIDSRAVLDTATLTTSTTGADQVVDSFSAATYRTAKYLISISSGTDYQSVELLVVHNGTTASQTTYADVMTNTSLAAFSVDISGGAVRLLTTPVNSVTVYKVARTAVVV